MLCITLLAATIFAASVITALPEAILADPSVLQNSAIKPRQVPADASDLPIIDLGYVKQQADRIETAGNVSYYVYKNIRFAAPPLGNPRFRKPQPPLKQEGVVRGENLTAAQTTCSQSLNIAGVALPPPLAGLAIGTEDCSFLDVHVPVGINRFRPLPVLLNFYGVVSILKSPGWTPEFKKDARNTLYNEFLKLAGCSTGGADCLRAANSTVLQRASGALTKAAEAGEYGPISGLFPVADGDVLPDTLPNRLKANRFHYEVSNIIVSSARFEAGVGTFPIAPNATDASFEALVRRQYTTNEAFVARILELYPPQTPVDGYSSGFLRTRDFIGDILFNCNSYYAASTYSRLPGFRSRKYIFNIPPSSHGGDLNYNDYGVEAPSPFLELLAPILGGLPGGGLPGGGGGSGVLQPVTRPDLAQGHQKWITDFVASGSVRKDWPLYRNGNEKALWLNDTAGGFGVADDYFRYPYRRQRCDILRDELYDKA